MRIEHLYSRETDTPFGVDRFDDVASGITQCEELHLAREIEQKIRISRTYEWLELFLEPVDVRPEEVHCEKQTCHARTYIYISWSCSWCVRQSVIKHALRTYKRSIEQTCVHIVGWKRDVRGAHTSIRAEILLSAYILERNQVRDADRRRCSAR